MTRVGLLIEAAALIAVPVALLLCAVFGAQLSALLSALVVCAALVVFACGYERSRPALRQVCPTVALAALAAAGRIVFAPIPDVKPVTAVCIVAGIAFGRRSGFAVGALAALCSNFFFGQGAWTPWQMYAWGLTGYIAGVLAEYGVFERFPKLVYVWGFLAPLVYGLLLNGWYVIGFVQPLTLPGVAAAYAAALPFDLTHAVATVVFLLAIYAPWSRKLERIKRKYAL